MHPINLLLYLSLVIGTAMVIWSCYDLYFKLLMRRALIKSLACDPEFLTGAPHVWTTAWEEQFADEKFQRLRAIIRMHIDQLAFRRPRALLQPLNQAHLVNRLRYVQGLVYAVEKRQQHQPQ
jgi:hypothetical protein